MIEELYPWVTWVQGPRKGPAANRNCGASIAKGKYFVFTDDDCLPSVSWLDSFAAQVETGGPVFEGRTDTDEPSRGPFFQAPVNAKGGNLWSCNMAVERSVFEALGGFDERFPYPHMEDIDFRTRLLSSGRTFVFVPEAIVVHPQRPQAPLFRRLLTNESYFYFSQKHRISLSEAGFNPFGFRYRARRLLSCRNPSEVLRYLWLSAAELVLIVPMAVFWGVKYRRWG
jgi:GT2 family glycosyltransferase